MWLYAFILAFLLLITVQDFRERQISWFSLPALFVLFLLRAMQAHTSREVLSFAGINVLFITLQMVGLTLWYSLKQKRWVNIIDTQLGLGDVLFFIAIAAAFEPLQYMLFYFSGLLLAMGLFLLLKNTRLSMKGQVPLAGILSGLLALYLIVELFSGPSTI